MASSTDPRGASPRIEEPALRPARWCPLWSSIRSHPPDRRLLSDRSPLSDRRGGRQHACSDLVEAATAVDGPVVPWRERDHRLAATRRADRRVVLTRSPDGPSSLRGGAARWASLWIVDQPLASEEGLFPRREDERLTTIPAGERAILEHPLRVLLWGAGRVGRVARGHRATGHRSTTRRRGHVADEARD